MSRVCVTEITEYVPGPTLPTKPPHDHAWIQGTITILSYELQALRLLNLILVCWILLKTLCRPISNWRNSVVSSNLVLLFCFVFQNYHGAWFDTRVNSGYHKLGISLKVFSRLVIVLNVTIVLNLGIFVNRGINKSCLQKKKIHRCLLKLNRM